MVAEETYPMFKFFFFFHVKSQFREKIWFSPIEKFPSIVQPRNAIRFTVPYYSIFALLSFMCSVKNKTNFQTFISKSGRGHLREGLSHKRFFNIVNWLGNVWYFRKLVAEETRSQPEILLYIDKPAVPSQGSIISISTTPVRLDLIRKHPG